MKYTDTQIGFQEFPDEISLLINISNCPFHCPGCHSPELWEDIGEWLDGRSLSQLIESNKGITCVGFMGGNPKEILRLAELTKIGYDLKVGWYWGGNYLPDNISDKIFYFDYIKLGPYIMERGGLESSITNQKFYHVENRKLIDWTYKFWKHEKRNKEC